MGARIGRVIALVIACAVTGAVPHAVPVGAQQTRQQGAVRAEAAAPETMYRSAREAMVRGDARQAARLFGLVASRYPQSSYATASLYYRAFLQYQQYNGDNSPATLREALTTLKKLESGYPNAPQLSDARSLHTRVCGELARLGDAACREEVVVAAQKAAAQSASATTNPRIRPPRDTPRGGRGVFSLRGGRAIPMPDTLCRNQQELDSYVAALNSLWKVDSLRAIESTAQLLTSKASCLARVREQALVMLIQRPSQLMSIAPAMFDVARNDPDSNVRRLATVWLLSQEWDPKAAEFLHTIFGQSFRVKNPAP